MKRMSCVALLFFSFAAVLLAQDSSFHVKSFHRETATEHGDRPSELVRYVQITGTFEGKTYTIEAVDAGWTKIFDVGKDYPATMKKNEIVLTGTFKGKPEKVSWRIVSIQE